jgi:hypothetical protein
VLEDAVRQRADPVLAAGPRCFLDPAPASHSVQQVVGAGGCRNVRKNMSHGKRKGDRDARISRSKVTHLHGVLASVIPPGSGQRHGQVAPFLRESQEQSGCRWRCAAPIVDDRLQCCFDEVSSLLRGWHPASLQLQGSSPT